MLIKILLTLVFLLAVLAIVAAFRPSTYHVERTITMAAPPARVFAEANDLHKYISWNPFGKSDPQAVYTYEGPLTGVGSAVVWTRAKLSRNVRPASTVMGRWIVR